MQEEVQQAEQNKRYYEKPLLAAVQLFADKVLDYCNDDFCKPTPDHISG